MSRTTDAEWNVSRVTCFVCASRGAVVVYLGRMIAVNRIQVSVPGASGDLEIGQVDKVVAVDAPWRLGFAVKMILPQRERRRPAHNQKRTWPGNGA
jgi:hypothetical protein